MTQELVIKYAIDFGIALVVAKVTKPKEKR